jgi:hypothetical protein
MQKPITSRVKRSPLLKYSPLKNDNDPAIGTKTTKGEDKEVKVTETKEKDSVGAYRRACGSTTDGSTKTDPKTGKAFKCAQAPKGQEPEETETVTTTKIEPGEDKKVDVTLKRTQEQDVLQPWEVRQQLRAGKRADREVNKYRRKMGKYGTFDEKGKFTRNKGLSQKELRKLDQAQGAYNRATNVSARVDEGAGSGYRAGTRIKRKEDRVATTGEFTDPEQVKMGARKQEIAEQANLTTDQSAGAIDPGSNPFANMDAAKGLTTLDYEIGQYYTPFQSKESPLKKSLKGDQYKLPKHLQNAIKAAPGKLKTPLKKGYFKNK